VIIVVMGVSGAGKTAVGTALAARLGREFHDCDGLHPSANVTKMHAGVPLTEEDRAPWLAAVARAIETWSADGRDVVLACSVLRKRYRDALRAATRNGKAIRFVHLKGGYDVIARRLRLRVGHFMPPALLKSQLETLEEPDAAEALVVGIDAPVDAIVATIVAGLERERDA